MKNYSQTLKLRSVDSLSKAEFCLTVASLSELQERVFTFLHPEEMAYWKRISFEKRQQSYLLGRYCAKQAVRYYHKGGKLTDILIRSGVFEYPVAYYSSYEKVQVTLSHCEQLGVALAFPETHSMGVDIEKIQINKAILEIQLTPNEQWLFNTCLDTISEVLYTISWTLKEALSKVLRTGMTTPFEIYALKNIVRHVNSWVSEFENFTQYRGFSFLLEDKWVCSIVYPKCTQLVIDLTTMQESISEWCFT